MDRIYLLAPALLLLASMSIGFAIFCALSAIGRPPQLHGVKHNQLFGPLFGRFLAWMIGPLERLLLGRVSANAVTAMSLLMCAVTGVAAGTGHLGGAVWLYAFAGILDVLDGRLARLGGHQTPAGALFDSVSDRWGELFVFAGFAWYLRDTTWLLAVLLACGASMMVSYTRARAEGLGIDLAGGMMQRAERVVLVAAGTLVAAWYEVDPETIELARPIVGATMLICGIAATGTAVNRWIVAYRALSRREIEVPAPAPQVPEAVTTPQFTRVAKVAPLRH